MPTRRFLTLIALLVSAVSTPPAFAQSSAGSCGALTNGYGPYDARTDLDKLDIVLGAHFTPQVEALVRGNTSGTPGGDIDYTLRAIPNHPRALMSMMRLGEKEKTQKPSGSRYTVECWFDRAMRFRPDDTMVRMIYTVFLTQNNRKSDALAQLDMVEKITKDSPFTHHNLGLLYFDLGEYKKALTQAHIAIEMGLVRADLQEKLQSVGQWVEPSAPTKP